HTKRPGLRLRKKRLHHARSRWPLLVSRSQKRNRTWLDGVLVRIVFYNDWIGQSREKHASQNGWMILSQVDIRRAVEAGEIGLLQTWRKISGERLLLICDLAFNLRNLGIWGESRSQ